MSINFEHVFYSYDGTSLTHNTALNDVSFSLDGHFFAALVGHTGSGKSTLIQHINALFRPTSGKVIVNDHIIDSSKRKIKNIKNLRKQAGVVFQFAEYQLFEDTILKDVAFGPKNFGCSNEEAEEKARAALKKVGLDESYYDKSPFEVSGGEKRRVAIAGILAIEPSILILDEPTAGLDPKGAENILTLFKELYDEGTSIIIVTHDMDIVLRYATSVLCLKEGRLVGVYTPSEFFFNEELLRIVEIDEPSIISFAKKLINNGMNLNKNNIKDIPTLINEIQRRDV